ncbi:MAG: hypothetical protein ABI418_01510, partial [Jatrophihabitantaceae bacterium]
MSARFEDVAERPGVDPGWLASIPNSGVNQLCAFCRSGAVRWVHALDPALVRYRVYGKGHTLPTFWTVCGRCEALYRSGDENGLIEIMRANAEWERWTTPSDVAEHV